MHREIYLTDRRFNMISRAKKYVAVLLVFCMCVYDYFLPRLHMQPRTVRSMKLSKSVSLPWMVIM